MEPTIQERIVVHEKLGLVHEQLHILLQSHHLCEIKSQFAHEPIEYANRQNYIRSCIPLSLQSINLYDFHLVEVELSIHQVAFQIITIVVSVLLPILVVLLSELLCLQAISIELAEDPVVARQY